jgi:hypothetical protein
MLVVAYSTGRASHVKQAKGYNPDKIGITWPSRLGVGRETNNPTQWKILLRKLKEMKLDGYIGKDMKQYTKVCG